MERLSHARAVEGLSGGCRGDTTIKDMNNNVRQNGLCRRVLAACVLGAAVLPGVADDRHRPHIVLVMLDDMGFSDLGCYGGEVETPHIDSLAAAGVRFSHFWNTGRSCPSRASLLTGCYQHDAGMGWMTAVDEHRPGYRGQVARELPLVSDLLRSVGYRTYMSGKWHITVDGAFGRPNGTYPVERGFDRSYGSLTGGSDYWAPRFVYSGLTPVDGFPDDFYYTTAITDSAVSFVRSHPADSPMFLYVAHYAPHRPLQAPADRVARCRARYRVGYDVLRRARFRRQQQMGLVPKEVDLPEFDREFGGHRPAWTELTAEQQDNWVEQMATYVAMIEIVDDGIGRLTDALRERGMLENTVFFILSDNGATLEGGRTNQLMADLSNTPYRSYKQWCYMGGTSSPLIVADGRAGVCLTPGRIVEDQAHITDVLPTCLDLAGMRYPGNALGVALPGRSLWPAVRGGGLPERDFYFEHQTASAVISGQWKLVRKNEKAPWELYDLSADPFETADLAKKLPDVRNRLVTRWESWAKEHHVLPLFDMPWGARIQYWKQRCPDQSGNN